MSGHEAWENIFKKHGHIFKEPHPFIERVPPLLSEIEKPIMLDLGCGTGRHLVYFAGLGYDVYGMDNSPTAIDMSQAWLESLGLTATLTVGDMVDRFPYDDNMFDLIVSVRVINHGRLVTIRGIISEMERVIKPGGVVFVTVATQGNQFDTYEEIEPNTYVPLDGREKGLLHYFFTEQTLREAFANFEVISLDKDGRRHLCMIGRYTMNSPAR